jgi:glutaredoxin
MNKIISNMLLFIALCISISHADKVYLKTGGTLNGIIKMEDNDSLIITVSIGEMQVDRKEVDSVAYSEESDKIKLQKQWSVDKNKNDINRQKSRIAANNGNKLKTIKIFEASWCGYCKKLKALLDANNIQYVSCDIEKTDGCKSEYDSYRENYTGIPLSVIGNTVIRGFDPEAVQLALRDPSAWEKK